MRGTSSRGVWKRLGGLFRLGATGQLSDEELLDRFVARRDEAAEAAFAALVERHGPMVLGVCRRVLHDRHQAEDAFQATFLVLTRKASSIARGDRLAGWLFGVACRTALGARARETRRRAREQRLHALAGPHVEPAGADEPARSELRAILDEELARVPERYRQAVVLCELEGLSRRAAAQRLGLPEGTLASRLARGKDALRQRLVRRGLALSVLALDAGLACEAEARALIVSPSLVDGTIRAAMRVAAGASPAEVASTSVASLTQGVLKAMLLAKTKGVLLGLATAAVITAGVGVVAQPTSSPDGDRLTVLERKLDQILEALNGSRPAARGGGVFESRRLWDEKAAPDNLRRFGDEKAAPDNLRRFANEKRAPDMGGTDAALRKPAADNVHRFADKKGAPDTGDTAAPLPKSERNFEPYPAGPGGSSSLATRLEAVEQRLAELERRINALERLR